MNKYQEALNRLKLLENWQEGNEFQILQELIDKSIPQKVLWIYPDEPLCPFCNNPIDDDYARTSECCEQRLDWSDDEA